MVQPRGTGQTMLDTGIVLLKMLRLEKQALVPIQQLIDIHRARVQAKD
jgi:hypothetical protein